MAHTRLYGFSLLALSIVAIWIAVSSAQESLSPYTAQLLDMTTGETFRAPADSDTDQDGVPDNPFITLPDDNTLWLAEVSDQTTGERKTVAALRWDEPARDVTDTLSIALELVRPDGTPQRVLLEIPREILAAGETGVVLLSVAPDPVTLLGAREASLLAPEPRGVLVSGGQYVEISIMVSDNGGRTYWEIEDERLRHFPIRLAMQDLLLNVVAMPAFHSHATYVDSNPDSGIGLLAEAGGWKFVSTMTLPQDDLADDGTQIVSMNANLISLSVFAPFDTGDEMFESSDTSDGETGDTTTGDGDSDGDGTGGTGGSGGGDGTGTGGGGTGDGTTTDTSADGSSITLLGGSGSTTMAMAQGGGYEVWVDFGAEGVETGTEDRPFNTIAEGIADAVANGHDTMKIARRNPIFGTNETPTISFPITLEAVDGPILIGQGTKALYSNFTGIGAVVYEPTGMDESMLSYAINAESRVFEEDTIVTLIAYAADGWRFDGWWYPTNFGEQASLDDFLPASIHKFVMERDRYVWPIFIENTTGEDVADPDDDGLANYRETEFGTNPNNDDSDGDGLPDGWEVNWALDPNVGTGEDGATGDPDGDFITNISEYLAGTNPKDEPVVPPAPQTGEVEIKIPFDPAFIEIDPDKFVVSATNSPISGPSYDLNTGIFTVTYPIDTQVHLLMDNSVFPDPQNVPTIEHFSVDGNLTFYFGGPDTFVALGNGNPLWFEWLSLFDVSGTWGFYIFMDTSSVEPRLKVLSTTGVRTDTGQWIPHLDGMDPLYISTVSFDREVLDWGRVDGYPFQIEQDEIANGDKFPFPRALVLFYNSVRKAAPNDNEPVPFSIELEAFLINDDPANYTAHWSFYEDSVQAGVLTTDGHTAKLQFDDQDPPQPGLYKFLCELRLPEESIAPPERTAVAYVLLPYAGPEILDWLIEEARQIAGVGGVGEQWVQHVDDEAQVGTINIPLIGPIAFNTASFANRAFISVSNSKFDYTFHTLINGQLPTRRFNFSDAQRSSTDQNTDNFAWNDPSYATLQGLTVARQKVTNVLWALWGRSVGKSLGDLLGLGQANNFFRTGKSDGTSAVNGVILGSNLYDSIVSGQSDAQIINAVLTRDAIRGIQSDGNGLNDIRLWPRPDFTASPHTALWTEDNLDDGLTWVRPTIFVPLADMDLNPLTNAGL